MFKCSFCMEDRFREIPHTIDGKKYCDFCSNLKKAIEDVEMRRRILDEIDKRVNQEKNDE